MDAQYLSVDEMAEKFEVSRTTAWRWIREQDIQTYRFRGDRKTYVKVDDLAQFENPIAIAIPKAAA